MKYTISWRLLSEGGGYLFLDYDFITVLSVSRQIKSKLKEIYLNRSDSSGVECQNQAELPRKAYFGLLLTNRAPLLLFKDGEASFKVRDEK